MNKGITLIVIVLLLSTLLSGCINNGNTTNKANKDSDQSYPIANFTIIPPIPMTYENIYLNSTSYHPDGTIKNWTWNTGDGRIFYKPTLVYHYNQSGLYNISLTIRDNQKNSDSITKTIFVYTQPLLNKVSLKIEDLPDGYEKYLESYNSTFGFNFSIPVGEVYNEQFIYEDPWNNSGFPLIITTLCRFNSSNNASEVLMNSFYQMNRTFHQIMSCVSTDTLGSLGNQSLYRLFQGTLSEQYNYENATWSFIYFRIQNITVLVLLDEMPTSSVDYTQLTYQYAYLIEDRIKKYFQD